MSSPVDSLSAADVKTLAESSYTALLKLLANPIPEGCIMEVLGSTTIIAEGPNSVPLLGLNYAKLRESALDAVSRWMSFRRSPTEVKDILSMTCSCTTSSPESSLHTIGASLVARSRFKLTPAQTLINHCTNALRQMGVKEHKKVHKLHHLISRDQWPYTTEQMLPHGPEGTVLGYLDWLIADDIVSVSRLAEVFATIVVKGWPLVVPTIIKNRFFTDQFLITALRSSELPRTEPQEMLDAYAKHFLGFLLQLSIVLCTICIDVSNPAAVVYFLDPQHEAMLLACEGLIILVESIIKTVRSDLAVVTEYHNSIIQKLESVASAIYTYFPDCHVHLHRLSSGGISRENADRSLRTPGALPWKNLMQILRVQQVQPHCTAPGCTRTSESHGRPFRTCTGCYWVQYCSRECQKNAWRHSDNLQHRDVCVLLRHISVRFRLSSSRSLQIAPPCPDMTKEDIVAVRAINKHFASLAMYDIHTRGS
jgi:hypothetical protein